VIPGTRNGGLAAKADTRCGEDAFNARSFGHADQTDDVRGTSAKGFERCSGRPTNIRITVMILNRCVVDSMQ
jgi:hypothetical protein